ncbi:MAG: nascent polypeptide-associated complex protein [Candidatus Woesearchaeota archaeon]
MIPGMNLNNREMRMAMRKMGIQQEELKDVTEVVIRCRDKDIVISNPEVSKVNMMGQESWQISGEASERQKDSTPEISEDDIQTVMEQTGKDREQVAAVLKKNKGDLAETIIELQ